MGSFLLRQFLAKWDPAREHPRFGTYRGLIRLLLAQTEDFAGRFRPFKQIRWAAVSRIVFVCSGNICRSPYAEQRAALHGLRAVSFGLAAANGMPADPEACKVAARRAVDLVPHRARDFSKFEPGAEDLLVVMEPRQAREILRRLSPVKCQLTLLGLWSRPPRPHIHDPHRLSEAYWEQCFDVIDSAVDAISRQMRRGAPDAG